MTGPIYHLANIRNLLTEGFDDQDLRALCLDVPNFRPVYDRLAKNTGTAGIAAERCNDARWQDPPMIGDLREVRTWPAALAYHGD